MIGHRRWIGPLLFATFFGLCGCVPVQTAVPPPPQEEPAALRLSGQEVHLVELDQPFVTTDQEGREQEYTQAFLVLFHLEYPPFWGPSVDLFIGDYRVPEFGDWEGGLYFRVYDPVLMEQLVGQKLSYRIAGGPLQSFEQVFVAPPLEELEAEKETEILR